jgi:hypothetical protein
MRDGVVSLAAVSVLVAGCSLSGPAATGAGPYVRSHPELPRETVEAMEHGHVLVGMTTEQVQAMVGQPSYKRAFGGRRSEVWILPAGRLNQRDARFHGASLCRIAFVDGRVAAVDPI